MRSKRTIGLPDLRNDHRLAARFWTRADRQGDVPEACPERGACWVWTGFRSHVGYGRLGVSGRNQYAHRVAWALTYGPLEDDIRVLHHCDVPACVRPEHLYLGTQHDNMRDMWNRGRHAAPTHRARAKLTPVQVLEARGLYAAGVRQRVIAERLGVTQTAISFLLRGETWKDI